MAVWVLLKAKALILVNTLLRRTGRQQLSYVVFSAFLLYIAYGIFQGLVGLLRSLSGSAPTVPTAFLTTTLSGLVTFALFWGLGSLLTQLYVSSDLELLLAAPLPPFAIYIVKLLEGMQTLLFPGALSVACTIAYGVVTGGSASYYLLLAVGLLALAVLLTALAMIVVMLIARVLPARRTRDIWLVIWTLAVGAIWVVWTLSANQGTGGLTRRLLSGQTTVVQAGTVLGWSPAGWLAHMLVGWQTGDHGTALIFLGILVGTSLVLTSVGYFVYQRAFYYGWSGMQEAAPRRRRQAAARAEREPRAPVIRVLPMEMRAIVRKEWAILPRDVRQLSSLLLPILMGAVFTYTATRGQLSQQVPGAEVWVGMAILPLIPFFMSLYYAVGSVAMEGREFALLKLAPLSSGKLLLAKYLASFVLLLIIAEVATLALMLVMKATGTLIVLALVAMAWFTAGFVAVGVGASTFNPNFKAANARRAVGAGVLYGVLLLNAAFWVVQIAVFLWLLVQAGPPSARHLLSQIVALAFPSLAPSLSTIVAPLALLLAEVAVWGIIAALWKRGMSWIDRWEISSLD